MTEARRLGEPQRQSVQSFRSALRSSSPSSVDRRLPPRQAPFGVIDSPQVHGGNFAPHARGLQTARRPRGLEKTTADCPRLRAPRASRSVSKDRVRAPAGVRLAHETGTVAIPCLKAPPPEPRSALPIRASHSGEFPLERARGGSSGRRSSPKIRIGIAPSVAGTALMTVRHLARNDREKGGRAGIKPRTPPLVANHNLSRPKPRGKMVEAERLRLDR